MISNQEYAYAAVEKRNPSKLPILLAGILTPQLCIDFHTRFRNFFRIKGTTAEVQVALVAASLWDVRHTSWIQADKQHLLGLNLDEFHTEFKKTFLSLDWERTTRNNILNTCQRLSDSSNFFVYTIQAQNSLLKGAALHMSPEGIKNHVDVAMQAYLRDAIDKANEKPQFLVPADSNMNTALHMWMQAVIAITRSISCPANESMMTGKYIYILKSANHWQTPLAQ